MKTQLFEETIVSRRQWSEAALREAHEKLQIIMHSSPLGILSIDPAGRIMSWNGGAERMFGWSEREAIGKICPTVAPEWLDDFHGMIARVMQGESITGLVRYRQKRDGTVITASLSSAPLRNAAGQAMGIMVILEDITDRKRTEAALRESEERFRLLVAGVRDYGIFMLDPDGHVMSWNAGAERLKGYQADEIIGQHFSRFYPPEDLQGGKPERELQGAAAEGRFEDEGWRLRKDGTRFWANVIITAIRDEAGTLRGFSKVTRDLTDRKRAEDLVKQSLQQVRLLDHRLEEAREAERARIAREIHDELGVTLTCLKFDLARLSVMASDSLTAEGLARMKDKIQSLSQQTDGTITQVQRIATDLRPGILDDLGLVAALEWQTQDFQRRTGIACLFRSEAEDFSLEKDRTTAIFRICQEALTNVARHAQATESAIELWGSAGQLVVEVRDNGMGLPEEKILDPHSIGLLGMRERVLPFGGELFIQGIPGEGTTIRVVMPLVVDQPDGKPQ